MPLRQAQGRPFVFDTLWANAGCDGSSWGGRVANQLFQLIAILATAKRPKDRLSRAGFVLIRVAQARSCWQMARYMRALMSLEGGHSGRTWANQLRNTPFRRISWSRWLQTRPYDPRGASWVRWRRLRGPSGRPRGTWAGGPSLCRSRRGWHLRLRPEAGRCWPRRLP